MLRTVSTAAAAFAFGQPSRSEINSPRALFVSAQGLRFIVYGFLHELRKDSLLDSETELTALGLTNINLQNMSKLY
jgi:hypothetical protein